MAEEIIPSRSKGKHLVVKSDLILASMRMTLRNYAKTTTVEQELNVSELLQGSRVNRPPLSSVANLPPTSNISAAFQGCSFQGCTINIIQKKPEFNPEEQ